MKFKYRNFTIEVKDFDAECGSIRDALSTYMWEECSQDYEEYMALRRADFEAEDQLQREEYNSSYNIPFGMECAREGYVRSIEQECSWIVDRWRQRFYNIYEEKSPRRRRNAAAGRL